MRRIISVVAVMAVVAAMVVAMAMPAFALGRGTGESAKACFTNVECREGFVEFRSGGNAR